MFNYSSPSVKNSALLALASIPHKLAGRLIFGIWCRAVLLFFLSSVGLLTLLRSMATHTHTGIYTGTRAQSQIHVHTHTHLWCNTSVSFVCETHTHWVTGHLSTNSLQQVSRFYNNSTVHAATARSATVHCSHYWYSQKCLVWCYGNICRQCEQRLFFWVQHVLH